MPDRPETQAAPCEATPGLMPVDRAVALALEVVQPRRDSETVPPGAAMHDRAGTVLPLTVLVTVLDRALADRWTLTPLAAGTGGPARYLRVGETGGRLGVISPLSRTVRTTRNRLRVSATGGALAVHGRRGRG